MAKARITYQYNFNYKIVAISTHLKDYRVSFYLNELLNLKLKRVEDLSIDNKTTSTVQSFEHQHYACEETEINYHLIQNKINGVFLLPSLKKFDFLLILKTENEIINQEKIIDILKNSEHFQIVYKVQELSKKENSIVENNILYLE